MTPLPLSPWRRLWSIPLIERTTIIANNGRIKVHFIHLKKLYHQFFVRASLQNEIYQDQPNPSILHNRHNNLRGQDDVNLFILHPSLHI